MDVARALDLILSQAAERGGVKDPVFVMLTVGSIDAHGRIDVRSDAPHRGGLAGNVTGRRDRSRVLLIGIGAAGLLLKPLPMDFARATAAQCPPLRIVDRARPLLPPNVFLTVSYAPGIVDGHGANREAGWHVNESPDGPRVQIADTDCFSGK